MSFGQPFPAYAPALHNSQLLLAAAAAAAASSSNSIGIGNSSTTVSKSSAPSDPTPSSSSFCPPSSTSSAVTSNSGGNLLTPISEAREMSVDGLRLLASAGGHHGILAPPGSQNSLPSAPTSQPIGVAGPHLPPMFAGLPSLDPYRLPPPHFGLYAGGISPAGGPLDLKIPDGLPPPPFAHPGPGAIAPFYYDPSFGSAYPYAADRYGNPLDLNGARRKNATRETTAALKAWLYEHRKNPYPTKGEKIMLAIITKMTLTQVSTWFANARRRLKKENKMTWSPRNRPGEDDDGVDGNSTTHENSGGPRPGSSLSSLGDDVRDDDDDDDLDDLGMDTVTAGCNLNEESAKHLVHGSTKSADGAERSESSAPQKRLLEGEEAVSPKKPKIWSIAETVASPDASPQKSKAPSTECPQQSQQQHQGPYHFTFPPWPHMAAAAFAGRSPLMGAPNSGAPTFPFGNGPPTPFAIPTSMSSLPQPHQLRPELFARNFFAPMPPTTPMMNAAAAAAAAGGLPGFLNGFSIGCAPTAFPFGFGIIGNGTMPGIMAGLSAGASQQETQKQRSYGSGNEVGDDQQQESKSRGAISSTSSASPVSSNGRQSTSSTHEPKPKAST